MDFDDVITAVGFECVDTSGMEAALAKAGYQVKAIGSCTEPGRIYDAVHGAYWAALEV
jgi:hypothetical protein